MTQWYFHASAQAERIGPLDDEAARRYAQANPRALAWCQGMSGWTPITEVAELQAAAPGMPNTPPPVPVGASGRADDIEFRIVGHEMQFVEIELDPGESAIAEAGALMFKDATVQMDTVFGAANGDQGGGFMGKVMAAGKRVLTGESLFATVYTQSGHGKGKVAFAAPYPGTVLAMKLDQHGGRLICQKDSFLAGARGVQIGVQFQRKIMTGLFGGEGFIMQKLEGDGWVFIHAGADRGATGQAGEDRYRPRRWRGQGLCPHRRDQDAGSQWLRARGGVRHQCRQRGRRAVRQRHGRVPDAEQGGGAG